MPGPASNQIAITQEMIASTATMVYEIARFLVDHPDRVAVDTVTNETTTILALSVRNSDIDQVIGPAGRTVRSLHTVVRAISKKTGHCFELTIEPERI